MNKGQTDMVRYRLAKYITAIGVDDFSLEDAEGLVLAVHAAAGYPKDEVRAVAIECLLKHPKPRINAIGNSMSAAEPKKPTTVRTWLDDSFAWGG